MAWMKKKMSEEEEKILAKDLGIYYAHKGNHELALRYFNECLDLDEDKPDADVIYRCAQTKRSMAQPEMALHDARRATKLKRRNPEMAMAVVDCLHELNQFENCACQLNDNIKRFKGNSKKRFQISLDVLHENFEDTVGEAYLPFVYNHGAVLLEAWRRNEEAKEIDLRPLWKVQREKQNCDVLSVLEKEEMLLPPVEIARRARAFTVFSQNYLQRSWVEVQFLRELAHHPTLQTEQQKESTPQLSRIVNRVNKEIGAVMGMLHARSPLYNINFRKCPNKSQLIANRETTLNRVQYQTHRTMHNTLRSIRALAKCGKVEKLAQFIESVMGDYVVVKTTRVMPWKFEFINEVYNHLAKAFLTQYTNVLLIICNKNKMREKSKEKSKDRDRDREREKARDKDKDNLRKLLLLPKEEQMQRLEIKFGDTTAYKEENISNANQIAYKQYIDRMEKRLTFAKYDIERAYIRHQIAKQHLKFNHYDKCGAVALTGAKDAKNCNSNIWHILNLLLMCKAEICLQKIEILKETLNECMTIAEALKYPRLCLFVDTCLSVTSDIMQSRKSKMGSLQSKRSKRSFFSYASQSSQEEHEQTTE